MKESCEDREGYLKTLSGLEKLTGLYIRKPAPGRRTLRSALSGTRLRPLLKPVYGLLQRPATPMKTPPDDLNIDRLTTRERAPLYFSDTEIAVYTVLFGSGDEIREPLVSPDNIRYFIITDQALREDSLWQKRDVSGLLPEEIRDDPVLCNRWCKMHPDRIFPEYEVSIYLDANILITSDLTPLIAGLEKYPVNMFRHRTRDCAYQEIRACRKQKKAPRENLAQDKKRLEKRGLPKHWGLLEAPVIARRHHDPLCRGIMDEWWKDFCESVSRRDQIALMECLWQLQIPPEQIGILGSNVRATGLFIQFGHAATPAKKRSVKIDKRKIILFCAALLLVLFKHFLISNLPIEARDYRTDDRLMVNMAIAIRDGKWLGDYSAQLLMKGSFFPMFLAAVNKLGLNYLGALNLINALAAFFFVSRLRGSLKSPALRFILFAVLLFDPCTFSRLSFQRVYRSSITEMEVLFLWGAYYGLYLRSLGISGPVRWREMLLIIPAGCCLWAIWNTREECFWMLPFLAAASLLIAYRYWKAGRTGSCSMKAAMIRCGMLLLPFIMLSAGNQILRGLNKQYYGEAVRLEIDDGAFSGALKSIYSVKSKEDIALVTVPREKLERIFAVSPALRQIRPELEEEIERYGGSDRHHDDGEVEDGWFFWGLKYAAFKNGAADSLPKSQVYWDTVHREIEAALDDPSSSLERQSLMPSPLMSPLQDGYLQKMPRTFLKTLLYVVCYRDAEPLAGSSGKSHSANDSLFESITNNIAVGNGEENISPRIMGRLPHLSGAARWLTRIGDLYRAVNPAAVLIGAGCFIIMAFRLVLKKQRRYLVPCLIISGMALSMLVVAGGVAYTDISAFPAISYHYLAGAYPLMLGASWYAILYTLQPVLRKRK